MAPNSDELRRTVEELHGELETVHIADPDIRELLNGAIQDIRAALDRSAQQPQAAQPDHESIVGRLDEAAQHFEESHPTLSGTIRGVVDMLSQMGI